MRSAAALVLTKMMLRSALGALEQVEQQRHLLFLGGEVDHLAHAIGGDVFRLHFELLGVVHVLVGQLQHAMAQRGGEQQHLALLAGRQATEDEAHVLDEAKVEHAVRLVDHHHFDGVEAEHVLLVVIQHAARRGDDDVATILELLALLVVIDTAVDQRGAQAGVAADGLGVLFDLDRQLAGGRDHQGARVAVLALGHGRGGEEAIHHGDQEGAGLAGARLGLAGDVAAGEGHWQGQRLDRRAAGEASLVEALLQQRMKIEIGEKSISEYGLGH